MRDDIENALEQLDVASGAFRRLRVTATTADVVAVRDIDRALCKVRRHLEDALPDAPVRPPSGCTEICASWCPNCGTCTCLKDKDGNPFWKNGEIVEDENCPLHARASLHAKKKVIT